MPSSLHLFASLLLVCSASRSLAQVPPNDACSAPIPLTCGQTVAGSTAEATNDITAIDCSTSVQAAGIWYSYAGDGQAVTLSTCINWGYDTKINVYSGTCTNLVCVAGNDDGGDCDRGSTVDFVALTGITYLILVQGYEGAVGTFEMTVECGPITSDFCQGALPIVCNQSIDGSTLEAGLDAAPACEFSIQAPGVWFTFTGIDDPISLSTCESFDYDTRINLYQGACGGLVCVASNDDTPGSGTCSTLDFDPDPSATYYVLVNGYDGAIGNFSLGLSCFTCGTPSTVLTSATDVSAFVYWNSLNPGAIYSIEYGLLGFVQGTGTVTTGTVSGTFASAEISGLTPGTEYAFFLRETCGPGDESATVGAFTFTTLADPVSENAVCGAALPIACGGSVEGDTQLSFFTPGPTCGSSPVTTKGLWYTFTGTGGTVILSTCDTADFDTKLSVYSGVCSDPVCVAGGDDAPGCSNNTSRVEFPTVDGGTYLVLVHGYDGDVGAFTLLMECAPTCSPIAENDNCNGALTLTPSGIGLCNAISGSNACAFATGLPNPPCDPYIPIVDVWYTFNTAGQTSFTALLAGLTAGEVNAALYADCGELVYVDCETLINGPWQLNNLETDTDYYLRIWNGGGEDAGSFAVCIETDLTTSIPDGANSTPIRIWPNPANDRVMIEGTTVMRLAVMDLQGRMVLTSATNGASLVELDITRLAAGSYVLRSLDEDGRTLGRFTKN